MHFRGIHHLAMATGSMDKTIRFWRDLIGLPLLARLGQPGYRQYFFDIGGRNLLTFFEWPGVEAVPEKDHGAPLRGPFAFDPNGIPIEFSCAVAGADIRALPLLADREPSPIAGEGTTPHPEHWPPVTRPTTAAERAVYPGAGSEFFHGKK